MEVAGYQQVKVKDLVGVDWLRHPLVEGYLSLGVDLLLVREGGTEFPNRQTSEPLAHVDASGEVLTLDEASKETTGEGITVQKSFISFYLGV